MTNLTTHPADKPQYIRNNLEVFSPTYVINDIPSPNLPHQKGSNCLKKKKKARVREMGAPTWGPNPLGVNQELTTTEKKKRGRKGRNLAIEDRGRKNFFSTFRTSEWTRTQRIFFSLFLSQNFVSLFLVEHDERQFNFGFSTHGENFIRHRSTSLG